jgi:hypothetical protein
LDELFHSAGGRLLKSSDFAESDVMLGGMGAISVHKVGYGHNRDRATAQPLVA